MIKQCGCGDVVGRCGCLMRELKAKLELAVELLGESQDRYDEHEPSCPNNHIDGICNCGASGWVVKRKTFIENNKAK